MVKDSVLRILEENRGSLISGGTIGRSIGVSRTAVWKAVSSLKEDGYKIRVYKSAGYCLDESCDKLSVCGISRHLSTKVIGKEIIILNSIPSTNSYLRKLAESGTEAGLTVIAENQTSGRGRMTRGFFSPPSGIYMSILFRPERYAIMPHFMTIAVAISVADAIEEICGVKCSLKWVNDVYIDGKKICGILTEGSVEAESCTYYYLITGIGINVYRPKDGFPDEIKDIAASVDEYGTKAFTRNYLIADILNRLESIIGGLSSFEKRSELISCYKNRLFMLHQNIEVISPCCRYPALAVDVNEHGNLIVKKEDGTLQTLTSGEISIKI